MARQDSTRTATARARTLNNRSQRAYKQGALTVTRSGRPRTA